MIEIFWKEWRLERMEVGKSGVIIELELLVYDMSVFSAIGSWT
jgi:hypothetical protein